MKYTLIVLLSVFLFFGCSNDNNSNPLKFYIANGVETQLMPTTMFTEEKSLIIEMAVSHNNRTNTMTSAVHLSPEQLKVIAFSDFVRLFTITYDGETIDAEYSNLLRTYPIRPAYILSDIQLIYYPFAALEKHLPTVLTVLEQENFRLISQDGQEIIRIDYEEQQIRLENFERQYAYNISVRQNE